MTQFGADLVNPVYPASYLDVTIVPGPGGANLTFSQALTHDIAGDLNTGWATWSHGYTGDVYDTIGAQDPFSLTIGLPSSTRAFSFYVEPTTFATFLFTATAQDGTFCVQAINGLGGASGFGFFTDGGTLLTSISINGDLTDFAVGEFGISRGVPDGGSTALFTFLGLLPMWGMALRRNRTA
jgi:hypothetical protein